MTLRARIRGVDQSNFRLRATPSWRSAGCAVDCVQLAACGGAVCRSHPETTFGNHYISDAGRSGKARQGSSASGRLSVPFRVIYGQITARIPSAKTPLTRQPQQLQQPPRRIIRRALGLFVASIADNPYVSRKLKTFSILQKAIIGDAPSPIIPHPRSTLPKARSRARCAITATTPTSQARNRPSHLSHIIQRVPATAIPSAVCTAGVLAIPRRRYSALPPLSAQNAQKPSEPKIGARSVCEAPAAARLTSRETQKAAQASFAIARTSRVSEMAAAGAPHTDRAPKTCTPSARYHLTRQPQQLQQPPLYAFVLSCLRGSTLASWRLGGSNCLRPAALCPGGPISYALDVGHSAVGIFPPNVRYVQKHVSYILDSRALSHRMNDLAFAAMTPFIQPACPDSPAFAGCDSFLASAKAA